MYKENDHNSLLLINYFIENYGYTPLIIKDIKGIFLENINNPNYQIIRIDPSEIELFNQQAELMQIKEVIRRYEFVTSSKNVQVLNLKINALIEYNQNNITTLSVKDFNHNFKQLKDHFKKIEQVITHPQTDEQLLKNINMQLSKRKDIMLGIQKDQTKLKHFMFYILLLMFIIGLQVSDGDMNQYTKIFSITGLDSKLQSYQLFSNSYFPPNLIELLIAWLALKPLVQIVEVNYGLVKTIIIMIISTMMASLFIASFNPSQAYIGLSPVVFSLMGALSYLLVNQKKIYLSLKRSKLLYFICLLVILNLVSDTNSLFISMISLVSSYCVSSVLRFKLQPKLQASNEGVIVFILLIIMICFNFIKFY